MPPLPPSNNSLVKRDAQSALMAPPPPPKRTKRPAHVLPEELYESVLSHIVARDFFPGLLETESQSEYLDALDSKDEEWIEESGRKVREILSTPRPQGQASHRGTFPNPGPQAKPSLQIRGASAPVPSPATGKGKIEHDPEQMKTLSLQQFQARYTSEDNESFNRVLDRQNVKRAEKQAWVYNGNRIPSNRRIAQAAVREGQEQRLLAAAHDPSEPTSQALTVRSSSDATHRPAGPDIRPEKPFNSFMFNPAGLSETHPHLPSQHDISQSASQAPQRGVHHAATRLPNQYMDEEEVNRDDTSTAGNSVAISAVDRAIHARLRRPNPYTPSSSAAETQSQAPAAEEDEEYEYVDDSPTAAEQAAYDAHGSLRTALAAEKSKARAREQKINEENQRRESEKSRTLEAMRASAGESNGVNGFTILAQSKREDIRDRLVEKSSLGARGSRDALHRVMGTPAGIGNGKGTLRSEAGGSKTPARRGMGGLTPAGRKLFGTLGGTPLRGGGEEGNGKGDVWGTPRRIVPKTPNAKK